MTLSEARRYERDPSAAQRDARKVIERHARDAKARKVRRSALPGKPAVERATRNAQQAETRETTFYEAAKLGAAERAMYQGVPRCEHVTGTSLWARRCPEGANDPDHVIGGAYRKDCEALGAEGLECLCRGHHDLKHASSPSRLFWLDHAAEHAERHGYKRLAALVAKARARYEAKHPEAKP